MTPFFFNDFSLLTSLNLNMKKYNIKNNEPVLAYLLHNTNKPTQKLTTGTWLYSRPTYILYTQSWSLV